MQRESDEDEDARKPAAQPTPVPLPRHENVTTGVNNDYGAFKPIVVPVAGELAFLVTHWLAEFQPKENEGETNESKQAESQSQSQVSAALSKIHTAAADLADAFASLGTFGQRAMRHTFPASGNHSIDSTYHATGNNVTYADMKRTWSCDPSQLDSLVQSSKSLAATVDQTLIASGATNNRIQASLENVKGGSNHTGGRTLQDAIVVADESSELNGDGRSDLTLENAAAVSALHSPLCFLDPRSKSTTAMKESETLTLAPGDPYLRLESRATELARAASHSFRRYFDLRIKSSDEDIQVRSMQRSLQYQRNNLLKLDQERSNVLTLHNVPCSVGGIASTATIDAQLDKIKTAEQACERVVAQLQRKLPSLEAAHVVTQRDLDAAHSCTTKDFAESKEMLRKYRDPVRSLMIQNHSNNRTVLNICHRQAGFGLGRGTPRALGCVRMSKSLLEDRKALLYNRFSHAATINTHLSYPVYCLRFDRTGRYFITGADDYLVKVFCIGSEIVARTAAGRDRLDTASYARGAVLVCTLKGHSGVINDISVSSDNAFLATASADGDCRVWGLRDGCPVAVLRGHWGGANMVSWSTLTPFRLVTAAADGLARVWDVREACLKRYGAVLGERQEYHLLLNGKDLSLVDTSESGDRAGPTSTLDDSHVSPQRPIREDDVTGSAEEVILPEPLLPPLPQPDELVQGHGAVAVGDGQFVANDLIDDGVKLVFKLQHGAAIDERQNGPGTRARRSAVNVICVTRCPFGRHIATGSDDGICRIWHDDDCRGVERIDASSCQHESPEKAAPTRSSRVTGALLLTLKGHLSAITDLHYSKRGDRILTACQMDGVVRVWSWLKDPASVTNKVAHEPNQATDPTTRNVSQLILKLTNPQGKKDIATADRSGPLARPNRSQVSTITCDVAIWVNDDTKIVTSQSELAKQSGSTIVPGSQYLFLWDSIFGHCLLGIPGAHSMPCPVVVPHPILSSVICSAGADGVVKLWDWDSGKCIFSHSNIADIGPIEAQDRGKSAGYLDGDFSPDGTVLVLTDDSGRVTVLDSAVIGGNSTIAKKPLAKPPNWMEEQYFSNDYYDLLYDSNGYCVELGSERPPHLAPRGARCSHSGAPFSAQVNEAFKRLNGPMPISARVARWRRLRIRDEASRVSAFHSVGKGNLVGQFDPCTTTLIQHNGSPFVLANTKNTSVVSGTPQASRSPPTASTYRLSSNYRWRDIADIDIGDEEIDQESDDEDFELVETRNGSGGPRAIEDSDSDEMELEVESVVEPSRTSRRRQHILDEEDDSGDEFDEYVSMNNNPSGLYVADYESHFFRMATREQGNQVRRQWLSRNESSSSYGGRKFYAPQIGDSVVYIPQAHLETLSEFPGVQTPPWHRWPEEATWPVVRCCIRNIRYRFPYKAYKTCNGVVAKLTLEVTGIPELAVDRILGWPSPIFTTLGKSHVFELNLFENNAEDFVIPLNLYASRLLALEAVHADNDVEVEAFYAGSTEDAEDTEYDSYSGRVVHMSETLHTRTSHPSLCGSGFCSLEVIWDQGTNTEPDRVSPWNVSVPSQQGDASPRPRLTDNEKKQIRDALNTIGNMPGVDQFFLFPVDLTKYSDYTSRVEVPMDLSFMKNRLDADYYATKYSAVADVRLIYVNCQKYNGELDELSTLARTMLDKFEALVLDDDERVLFHKFSTPVAGTPPVPVPASFQAEATAPSSVVQRRSRRVVVERSTLEVLSGSAESNHRRHARPNRPSRAARIVNRAQQNPSNNATSTARRNRAATGRSILEGTRRETLPTLEDLSSGRGQRGRATRSMSSRTEAVTIAHHRTSTGPGHEVQRRPRQASLRSSSYAEDPIGTDELANVSNARRNHHQRIMPHRTIRAGLRNAVYAEVPSDAEDPEVAQRERASHVPRPSQRRTDRVRAGHGVRAFEAVPEAPVQTRRSVTLRMGSRRNTGSNGDGASTHAVYMPNSSTTASITEQSSRSARFLSRGREGASPSHAPSVGNRRQNRATSIETVDSSNGQADARRQRQSPRRGSRNEEVGVNRRYSRRDVDADTASIHESDNDDPPGDDVSDSSAHVEASSAESDDNQSMESDDSSEVKATRKKRDNGRQSRQAKVEKEPKLAKRTVRSRNESSKSMSRSSRGRGGRHLSTYEDPSSSEFGSDNSSDHDNVKAKATLVSRKRKALSPKKPNKKYKGGRSKSLSFSIDEPARWPEIALAHIGKVTNVLLGQLRELDADQLFWIPVVETYPELEDTYSTNIARPIDFRTIEEDCLNYYTSITQLQDDLILVFRNCMEYNEPDSSAYQTASLMMGLLADTFTQACETLQVRVLRHRSK